jgi:20S proteasome alpha/beta subunit
MTCIAWDGVTLAADKRATSGGGIARTVTKIERHGSNLLAVIGSWDVATELRAWFKAGAKPEAFPESARSGEGTLVVITPGKHPRTYATGPHALPIEQKCLAFGSGRDYAEAAMFLGCDAKRAVEVACQFQTDCGNGIDTLRLK